MKRIKLLAMLLSLALLCCACSAAAITEPQQEAGMGLAIPLSESVGGFSDVPAGAYYEAAANWCRERGIFSGALFSPDRPMTRATVADALYRAEGSPSVTVTAFPDIPAESAYAAPHPGRRPMGSCPAMPTAASAARTRLPASKWRLSCGAMPKALPPRPGRISRMRPA